MTVLALRATGLLQAYGEAGILSAADVHVAQRLGVLAGEPDERVLLAAALTVRGTRHGSVVLDLDLAASTITVDADEPAVEAPITADAGTTADAGGTAVDPDAAPLVTPLPWPAPADWIAACAASPLVTGAAGGPPLRMVGSRLWLDRYWRQETQVATDLLARAADRPADLDLELLKRDLAGVFARPDEADQRLAAAVSALSRVSVVAGGPGTGKTTTVARLLTVLLRQLGPDLRIALAAPTGKASARLEEAVRSAGPPLTEPDRAALASLSASTLHRLLGRRPGVRSRFRHDRDNHLPFDVVVVDESSMVSLTLMARLLEALAPATRLVLVGDPDQLASVEAGAVLGDLVEHDDVGPVTASFGAALAEVLPRGAPPGGRAAGAGADLRDSVAMLRTVHRFQAGGPIAALTEAIRAGRAEPALAMLQEQPAGLEFWELADDGRVPAAAVRAVQDQVLAHEGALVDAARGDDPLTALNVLDRHRLLCAHRVGPRGVRHWDDLAEQWVLHQWAVTPRRDGRYLGQPLLVTANDYDNGLYNGDSGVVVQQGEAWVGAFRRGGEPIVVPLGRLADIRPLHAMTVHRAQGSQFDAVTVVLPLAGSPLATREMIYTAVSRATSTVRVIGSAEAVLASVRRPAARATGLRDRLRGAL